MTRALKLAVLAAAAAFATPPALAFDCGPEHIIKVVDNFRRMQQPGISGDQLNGLATEITLDAGRCKETGWIRIIAAGAVIQTLNRDDDLYPADSDEMKAVRFNRLGRAIDHVLAFRDHYPGEFRHGAVSLRYDDWSGLLEPVVHTMLRYADEGHIHPLASDDPPALSCDYVSSAMATNASNFRFARSPASLRLLTSVADVCRTSEERTDWSVLAQRANKLVTQVDNGTLAEPDRIRWALREAYRDSRQYLDGKEAPFGVWFDSHEKKLREMLEKYPASLRFFEDIRDVPQADWFLPENIGEDATVHSIALAFSQMWSPLAAGVTDASTEEITKARLPLMRFASDLGKQADAAGQGKAGRAMIAEGLAAFQEGIVRTPETATLPGAPVWLYEMLHRVMTKEEAPPP